MDLQPSSEHVLGLLDTPVAAGFEVAAPIARVVIGHMSPMLLRCLQMLIDAASGMRVAATARDADTFIARCSEVERGVALVDAELCSAGTRALLDRLRRAAPQMRALLVNAPQAPHQVREALEGGASGFVEMTEDAAQLQTAIAAVAAGRRYLPLAIAHCLADAMTLSALTARERDVLHLLARGCCNKSIARELAIGVGTVKTHMRALMSKLDASSRTQAVLRASRLGLISL